MTFNLDSQMREIETRYPMARTVLHAEFHVGGCTTCGYQPTETLAEVATKHGKDADRMLDLLNGGLERMRESCVSAKELAALQKTAAQDLVILDVREPWEFELARIPGAQLVTEANLEPLLEGARRAQHVIVSCHHGIRSMNAALFFQAHGVPQARSLSGGIDAYSLEIDSSIPRY